MRGGAPRLLLAVALTWVAAAHLAPLAAMARISLMHAYPGGPGADGGWTLAPYAAVVLDAGRRGSLLHSLALAAVATLLALLVSLPVAWHVAANVPPARRGRRLMLLAAPFWASEVMRMVGIVLLLANRGALNALLRWAGVSATPLRLLYTDGAVLAGLLYTVLPAMLLPLYAAFDRLSRDVLEAASDLGADGWSRFAAVTVPMARRGIAAGVVLAFLAALGVFAAPALLGGAGTPAFAALIADLFGAASGRWPEGAASGFVLLGAGAVGAAVLAGLVGAAGAWRRT